MPGRRVTLALCTPGGNLLGALPPFDVPSPQWREVDDVVAAARDLVGVEVRVLRLLSCTGPPFPGGGPVSYLAETDSVPDDVLLPWSGADPLIPHPHRMRFAEPGGHATDLRWAAAVLRDRGVSTVAAGNHPSVELLAPQQIRTWNLSSIWRLPTTAGDAWLKVAPPFFAHEGALLPLLDPDLVPPVLGAEPGRVLLGDVPGVDQYEATGAPLLDMVRNLVRLQAGWIDRADELLALGVPDRRPAALLPRITAVVQRLRAELPDDERRLIDGVIDDLPRRFADIAACGLPDTLVHGDFHPGNVRGTSQELVILDWGDSGIGQPLIDLLAFCRRLSAADRAAVEKVWAAEWQRVIPGSDASRATALLGPVAALNAAVVYQHFLDCIEPAERPYHEGDPVAALREAVRSAA